MNIRLAAQTVRDSISMEQILHLYGYQANRQGFMCCPFHGEREGSLKIYPGNGGWHCFGCGRGGSVIDFVMEHESCDFKTAVLAIDNVMGLHLMDPRESALKASRQRQIQIWLDNLAEAMNRVIDTYISNLEDVQQYNMALQKHLNEKKSTMDGLLSMSQGDMLFLNQFDEEDDYIEYKKETARDLKEEVAAWRRKYRRAI